MSRKVGNFEILSRMASENKDIMMCPDVLNMKYSEKTKGTKVEFGVPGNVIAGIFSGDKTAILLMWDKKQFNELKAKNGIGRGGVNWRSLRGKRSRRKRFA